MKTRILTFIILAGCLTFANVRAQDTLFGEAGSGQPTKTVIGILGGAAAGSAIGAAAGGHDAPWIGALVGSTVGGIAGNQWGASTAYQDRDYAYETRPRKVRLVEERRVVRVNGVPYGYLHGGKLKSPWSDFQMSVGGKAPGQIVYDPNTGQPFRVP